MPKLKCLERGRRTPTLPLKLAELFIALKLGLSRARTLTTFSWGRYE
jgi:hypothetical protein